MDDLLGIHAERGARMDQSDIASAALECLDEDAGRGPLPCLVTALLNLGRPCISGFVVSQHYGLARETADLDVLTVIPQEAAERVAEIAGQGSPLQRKHKVYIDQIGIANYPADYEARLIRVFPVWPKVRLWALDPHDLALTKLERSNERISGMSSSWPRLACLSARP